MSGPPAMEVASAAHHIFVAPQSTKMAHERQLLIPTSWAIHRNSRVGGVSEFSQAVFRPSLAKLVDLSELSIDWPVISGTAQLSDCLVLP